MVGGNFEKVLDNIKLLQKSKGQCEVSHYILEFDKKENIDSYPQEIKDAVDYYEIWKPHNWGDAYDYRELMDHYKLIGQELSYHVAMITMKKLF